MQETAGIHVYAIDGKQWTAQQFIATDAPASMALHPGGHTLYVANEVNEYLGLPRGTVEAFRIAEKTGQLISHGCQPLSLSATMPRHIAVAPDGRSLVAASHGGGIYNRLPILPNGQLGRVDSVFKETGCGPIQGHQESAHPQAVCFDPAGNRFIAADLGTDNVSVFSIEDGLSAQARFELPAGSGPRHLALHPNGNLLYVAHALDGSVSGLRYDANAGKITERLMWIQGGVGEAFALHPRGDFLFTAGKGEITVWQIDGSSGALRCVQSRNLDPKLTGSVHEMSVLPQERQLIALTGGGVLSMAIQPETGRLGAPVLIASAPEARSIAIL
jgi:6-phosphogluconolactonase (cycloisomerase 2 family)